MSGGVGSKHQYVDMPSASVDVYDPKTNSTKEASVGKRAN